MVPWPVRVVWMAWLRRAVTRAPSSRVKAPAITAAGISPWEWPMTAVGWTPRDCQTRASETMTANSAGWTISTRSMGCPLVSTSVNDQSTYGARAFSHSAIDCRKTSEVLRRSVAMPVHCEPWPGKTKTGLVWLVLPVTTLGCSSPLARAWSACRRWLRSWVRRTARCSRVARPVRRVCAMAYGSVSGWSSTYVASCVAWARRASGVRAERTIGTTPVSTGAPAFSGTGSLSGASSRMTWALVPLIPKADTAARRGPVSPRTQARSWVSSSTAPAVQST